MEVEELKIELKQKIKRYEEVTAVYHSLVQKAAIIKKIKINTQEAASLLGVKPRTIRKYHEDKRLVGFKFAKAGMLRFLVEEVEDLMDEYLRCWDNLD